MVNLKFNKKGAVKNKNSGITLISLVVTIIILLILAGISIGMLSGDNSIIKQAGNAKTQTDIAEEKEILQTASLSAISKEKYGDLNKDKLDDELDKMIGNEAYDSKDTKKGIKVTFTSSGRSYLIETDGNVEMKENIKIPDGLQVGSIVTYEPIGNTYKWQAEYASSDLTSESDDITLDSTSNGNCRITSWVVFKIDEEDGEIQLVPNIMPSITVRLQGAQGYNNGVKLLNDACEELYSYSAKDVISRSINIEDIESILDETKLLQNKLKYTYTSSTYNGYLDENNKIIVPFVVNKSFPLIYEQEVKSIINGNERISGLSISDSPLEFFDRTDTTILNSEQTISPVAIQGYLTSKIGIQPYQTFYSWNDVLRN